MNLFVVVRVATSSQRNYATASKLRVLHTACVNRAKATIHWFPLRGRCLQPSDTALLRLHLLLFRHVQLIFDRWRRLRRLDLLLLQSLELIHHRVQVSQGSHALRSHALDVLHCLIRRHTFLDSLLKRSHHCTTRAANWTDHCLFPRSLAESAKQITESQSYTSNLAEHTARCLIHRLSLTRRRETTQNA